MTYGVMPVIAELKRRKLIPWTAAYLAGGWVALQVLGFLSDAYNWSPSIVRIAPVVLAGGFLLVVVLAWFHGDAGRQRLAPVELMLLGGVIVITAAAALVLARPPAAASDDVARAPAIAETSVAVLPFQNFSADKEQEYFSDGITEEILNALAQIEGLQVAARTSSFAFKNQNVSVDSIGARLRVAHILEGSVRKAGTRLRITTQLVKAETGYHMWSETFDRDASDVFALQDEIARRVAGVLKVKLAGAADTTSIKQISPQAHNEYLLGLYYWNRRSAPDLNLAIEHFTRATQLQPDYAQAYAGLARTYVILPTYESSTGAEAAIRGERAAQRALELDADLPEAHTAMGYVTGQIGHRWAEAERHFQRALERNPNDATAQMWYGQIFMAKDPARALAMIQRAVQMDPLSKIARLQVAHVYNHLDRLSDAAREYEALIAFDSAWERSYLGLRVTYVMAGDSARALETVRRWQRNAGGKSHELDWTRGVFDARFRDAAMRRAELEQNRYTRAVYHSLLRDRRALDDIDEALRRRNPDVYRIATHPAFAWLRGDARFKAALKTMNLD
jgi:TolB-like protein/Flp pilus assembly protein TadD